MISIAVSAQRVFTFPADLATTKAYLCDFEQTLKYLPYLSLVRTYARNEYRILYSVAEAGVYYVAFYCDIQVQFDETTQTLHVTSLAGVPLTAGFFGKFFAFTLAVKSHLWALIALAVIGAAAGFYYYFKVVRSM